MIRCETITWHPYPDEKPEQNGSYLCLYSGEQYGITFSREMYWDGKGWKTDPITSLYSDFEIAFSENPKGYDPTAKRFNFVTALELMKQGKKCMSNKGYIYVITCMSNGKQSIICHRDRFNMYIWNYNSPTFSEIEGEWEEEK